TTDPIEGTLVGADTKSKRFHFIGDNATTSIRGKFTDAISEEHKAILPTRYTALIKKTVQTTLATEEEKISHFLVRLGPPTQPQEIPVEEDNSGAEIDNPET